MIGPCPRSVWFRGMLSEDVSGCFAFASASLVVSPSIKFPPSRGGGENRCRANSEQISQSGPEFGAGLGHFAGESVLNYSSCSLPARQRGWLNVRTRHRRESFWFLKFLFIPNIFTNPSPPWSRDEGKSEVNHPQMPPLRGGICMGVD